MTQIPDWSRHHQWSARLLHVGQARAFVSDCLTSNGLTVHADVVALVASELSTNAVVHAATPFTVYLSRRSGELILEVHDGRLGLLPPPSGAAGLAAEGGRGLLIVEAMSTSWGVWRRRDGKTVWASFSIADDQRTEP